MIVRFWELKPFNISINFFAWNQVNHYKYFLLGEWNFLGGWGLKALWYACDSQVFSTQANVVETSSLVGHMVSSHRVYHSSQCFTSETFSIEISVCVCVLTFTTVECCDSDMTGSFYTPGSCWGWQHVFSFLLSVPLQFMRHHRQNRPFWMRLTMALFGFLFPREAVIPHLRGEHRWRDFFLALTSAPYVPNRKWGTGLDGTVRWNTGLDFCFLVENDEMKKTLVTAGRRLINFFLAFVCLFVFCLSEKKPFCLKRYFRNICKITYFVQ